MRPPCIVGMTLALLCGCNSAGPSPVVPLDRVLTEVQRGLQKAQDDLDRSSLGKLQSVQLTLHTQSEEDKTGNVTIFVISVGGGLGVSASQDLVLTLRPPVSTKATSTAMTTNASPTVADSIVALIKEAANAAEIARKGKPPLDAETLTLELAFTVTNSVKGGLQFNLGTVAADVGGSRKNASQQRIKITIAPPKPAHE
jgi:hypothetical protein